MALTPILTDGSETGSSAALKINAGFTQTDTNQTALQNVTTRVTVNEASIVTNGNSISTNTTNITTNTNNITTNTTDIAALQAEVTFTPSFNWSSVSNIVVPIDVYTELNRLDITALESGIYKMTFSMIYNLDSTTKSAYFRFSSDNGVTWHEIRRKSKDVTDIIPLTHSIVETITAGDKNIIVEAKKEDATTTLTVLMHEIMYERKL